MRPASKTLPKKTRRAQVMFTSEQYQLIVKRAERRGLPVSVWMRQILLQAVNRPEGQIYLRVQEPNGATS